MPLSTESITPHYIFEIILRRRWYIMVPLCCAMIFGIYLSITLPRVYKARTLILVEPQRVPSNYVKSVVSIDIGSRISTISQQVMSRTNIEKIINDFNIFTAPGQEKMYLEDKLEAVRRKIEVDVTRTRSGTDAFSISYKGQDPDKVMRVANRLASYFIDENLRVREEQATGTSSFLDDELKLKKQELQRIEYELTSYRIKHMGGLPEQLETNLRTLDRLHTEYNAKQAALREIRYNMSLAKEQSSLFSVNNDLFSDDDLLTEGSQDSTEVAMLKDQIEKLKLKYTEKHPDVVRLQKRIEKIEAQNKEKQEAAESDGDSADGKSNGVDNINNFDFAAIQNRTFETEIKKLENDLKKIEKEIEKYNKLVEDTAIREQELYSINRDYENVKDAYNSLLSRKLEAGISVSMERKQKGEQFRVIDYATLPEKPISPDVKKLFVLMVLGGIGIGGGLSFVLEFFNHSYRDVQALEDQFNFKVLAVIPTIIDQRKNIMKKLNTISSAMMAAATLAVFGVFAFMAKNDVNQIIESVKNLF